MRQHQHENKVRLSVDCTEEERMYIKMLAAKEKKSISEYLLSLARPQMPQCGGHHCNRIHEPNAETAKILKETDEGKNLVEYESLDDFWESLGFNQNA